MGRPNDKTLMMTTEPGTYALVLACQRTGSVRIGRRGTLKLQPGVYIYVGSAFGPGGLSARIKHHSQIATRPHWHIDYLRAVCDLAEVWFTTSAGRHEHAWAKAVAQMEGATIPMAGFGSSDCACESHLCRFGEKQLVRAFGQRVKTTVSMMRATSAGPTSEWMVGSHIA